MLEGLQPGEPTTAEELLLLVYDELRRLAASKLADERRDQAL